MIDQGIDVVALNFTSAFCTCNAGSAHKKGGGCRSNAMRVAGEFGIPIKVLTKGLDYMEIVRSPRFGYGKGINPCIDCRIYMFSRAKDFMAETGASFIVTGEVLGQRPMSQRRDTFRIIERESGLEGRILRPLSAKHLEPTIPEKEGIVDRRRLLDMLGRTRRPQMELADELNINDYPCPSGGCLLTDRIFSMKVRDLLAHKKDLTLKDLHALKTGRHFRFEGVKVIVGRNEEENRKLKNLLNPGDTLFEPVGFPGPVAVVSGEVRNGVEGFVGGLILRYAGSKKVKEARIRARRGGSITEFIAPGPPPEGLIEETRVC